MNIGPTISKEMQIRAAVQAELGKRFEPHRGQKVVLHAYYVLGCKHIFIQCGRKWGKTEIELRIGVENCMLPTNDGETTLYVAYEDDQAKKIVWTEGRILKFCHPMWVKKISETDMTVEFVNGRRFQVDGSNNYKKHEGVRPSLLLGDEFKRFRPEFLVSMEPNLSVYDAACVLAGSPPDGPCQYTERAEFVRKIQSETGEGFFTQQPSWMNDKTPGLIDWLVKARKQYEARGEMGIWNREYGAVYSQSGSRMIFPHFNRERVQRSEEFLKEQVSKNPKEWDWYCVADPATGDPFAVLFMAIHRTARYVAVVDGIYETDRSQKTLQIMWGKIQEKIDKWYPNYEDWSFIHDDQNAWWGPEFQSQIPESNRKPVWTPAGKQTRTKDSGISIANSLWARDMVWINQNLEKFFWEFSNYQTDENGKIKKGNDHYIDAFRYGLYYSRYDPQEIPDVKIPDEYLKDPWLLAVIQAQEGLDSDELMEDWTLDMFSDMRYM